LVAEVVEVAGGMVDSGEAGSVAEAKAAVVVAAMAAVPHIPER
jgi:hypothetical protein